MPILVPKIVWPSGGGNELIFAFPPVNVRPFDRAGRRHDTVASSGERQSLLERVDKFLELDLTLVPTEVENYLSLSEEFDKSAWVKAQTGAPGVPVVTADQVANPQDEVVNADQIDFPVTGAGESSRIEQNAFSRVPDATERVFVFPVFLRAGGAVTIRIHIRDGVATSSYDIPLTTTWQRPSVVKMTDAFATQLFVAIENIASQAAKTIYAWGAQLSYDVLGPYVKTGVTIPAAIDRWDTFITAVLDGTNFDYYPDAFAATKTTYVLEDKRWRPKLQVRGANRFYEFKLRLREFV